MADLKTFKKRMEKRAKRFPDSVNKVKRRVALVTDQILVSATPVDTGRARSNWFVSLDTALDADETFAPLVKDDPGGSARVALDKGARTIARAKPGQVIHITNNLPYIVPLNEGSSAQAPAGFVEEAIAMGAKEVARLKILDK